MIALAESSAPEPRVRADVVSAFCRANGGGGTPLTLVLSGDTRSAARAMTAAKVPNSRIERNMVEIHVLCDK